MAESPMPVRSPYSRQRTDRWLSWIAAEMQKRGQSVFFVERLQPSWLPHRWQRIANLVTFESILGLLLGWLINAFWSVAPALGSSETSASADFPLWQWLLVTWAWVLILGIVQAALGRLAPRTSEGGKLGNLGAKLAGVLGFGAIWCLLWVVLNSTLAMIDRVPSALWSDEMRQPLITGAILVSLYQIRILSPRLAHRVQSVEALGWSWADAFKGAAIGAYCGATLWVLYGMATRSTTPENLGELAILDILITAALGFLFGGLRMEMLRRKALPNQGIWLSARNAVFAGLLVWPLLALLLLATSRITAIDSTTSIPLTAIEASGLIAAVAFLWYGGLDFLRHWILRLFICGHGPWDVVHFLAYATRLGLINRVGGGFVFEHRYLQDYFAELASPPTAASPSPHRPEGPSAPSQETAETAREDS